MSYRVVHTDDVPVTDVANDELSASLGDVRRAARLLGVDALSLDLWHVDAGEVAPVRPANECESAYLVLDGELTLVVGTGESREAVTVEAGSFATVTHGRAHGFENRSRAPALLLAVTAPAADTGGDTGD